MQNPPKHLRWRVRHSFRIVSGKSQTLFDAKITLTEDSEIISSHKEIAML